MENELNKYFAEKLEQASFNMMPPRSGSFKNKEEIDRFFDGMERQVREFIEYAAKRALPDEHGVTEQMYKNMEHAIGLDNNQPYRRNGNMYYKAYRNYFETPSAQGNPTTAMWDELVELGYANNIGVCWYELSPEGMSLVAERRGIDRITEVN